jgi:triosephosphate isomerase (TIM)
MASRIPIVAGNWKMHKTAAESAAFIRELSSGLGGQDPACEVIVAPAFTSLSVAVESARGTVVAVSAQNLHWEEQGAFTGEVSAGMIEDLGCTHVIIGHSERRQYFGETDETVNRKIRAAVGKNLVPIFCLGETLEEREAGNTFEVVKKQVYGGLEGISASHAKDLIVAYEPVWAIGTGRTASPEQAQEIHEFLRNELADLFGTGFADSVRVLYGGSVKPSNARDLMSCKDIDGGLVGGAALKTEDFLGIIREGTL